ncbi:branched-chain-amino-acid aminotransferase-like protein 1 isoform X2 [Humulus lupulus]|uniref:branched-chain-amino-acid aminotransferase-like protein 1 isoform X2 n=1 Tax=Humulus lupulus TaxID=3486 RepID=UPI002B408088|nr:branched-chain-amino-acid aminotransferase-like protein 1 isoform X2 [Humulus lupulus]XP_062073407.1 branched-chain-amino-acid aminotransferase-like protein 1 isoform X2 [Humulus lupulus]XP_062073408.1 branched-chain-amino-acid aminotransferase-like protein 1 isoform X2 [Humulus lupulus]XP_062073409.1 branched-chain-amino-acid aminotransferase-like protein 1 isoform X2 [Humulus lupulus]XP_062073410.1 branched-chain-amino-acid aminotransferase-like protein 1 isoform X2 [Humulus lupulus]XP_06
MASAKIKNLLVDLEKRFFEQAQRIHHNNLLNNILAKIEGNNGNAGDAIMLDYEGFVYETNATNIFVVKKGHVLTPHADYCLPGITRATILESFKCSEHKKEKIRHISRSIYCP